MDFSHWLILFGICLLGAMSPGPSLAVVVNTALRTGRGAGFACATAHGAGVGLYGLLTVAGLAVIITRSPALFLVIQLAGATYLLYLGVRSLRSGKPSLPTPGDADAGRGPAVDGFLIAFLNPKLAFFMLALFSQFLHSGAGVLEKCLMVFTVGTTDALWYNLIVLLITRRAFLDTLQGSAVLIGRVFGVILILLALTVVLRATL